MSTRNISLNFVFILLFFLVVDIYVYFAYRKTIKSHKYKKIINLTYYISVVCGYIGLYFLYNNFTNKPLNASLIPNLFIGFFFSFFVFKLILIVVFLLEDVARLFSLLFAVLINLFSKNKKKTPILGRRKFIRQTGVTLAALPFVSMLYGITKGKYNFRLNKVTLNSSLKAAGIT